MLICRTVWVQHVQEGASSGRDPNACPQDQPGDSVGIAMNGGDGVADNAGQVGHSPATPSACAHTTLPGADSIHFTVDSRNAGLYRTSDHGRTRRAATDHPVS